MRNSRRFNETDLLENEDDESNLAKRFREIRAEDGTGILYLIEETMQEVASKLMVVKEKYGMENERYDSAMQLDTSEYEIEPNVQQEIGSRRDYTQFSRDDDSGTMTDRARSHNEDEQYETGAGNEGYGNSSVPPLDMIQITSSSNSSESDDEDSDEATGIFGTKIKQSKKSKWGLSYYLQSVASTREKRIIAVSAWITALVGLLVSLTFVTIDFIESKKELASTIRYENGTVLQLPAIWLCSVDSQLPTFSESESEFKNTQPLFWIDFVRGGLGNVNYTYPTSRFPNIFEEKSVDITGKSCQLPKTMDPVNFFFENKRLPKCFYCIVIHRSPKQNLSLVRDLESSREDENSRSTISLRISTQLFLTKCRMSQVGLRRDVFFFFRRIIRINSKELQERQILDFGKFDPSNPQNDGYLWPFYRAGYKNASSDFAMYDVVDMFCNVYLFSNLFYPSTKPDIKFKFSDQTLRWERVGRGPYYPPKFLDYYNKKSNAVEENTQTALGQEKFELNSFYQGNTIQMMTNYTQDGGLKSIATLHPRKVTTVSFSKLVVNGKELFETKVYQSFLESADVRSMNFVYFLNLGIQNLFVKTVSHEETVSWSAFIADFFGLTSMFLDISVYTLIVSPLIVRARRRALLARTMGIS